MTNENEKKDETFSRRHFLEIIGAGAVGVAAVGSAVLTAQYLSPNVLHELPLNFKAGHVEDYPPDSATLIVDQKAYVVRAKEGYFYAMSAVCTHLGCITGWKSNEGIIACPCHGSKFDRQGNVIEGPAPRPLPRFLISLEEGGQLIVDKNTVVSEETVLKV